MLAKNPIDRPANPGEVADAIQSFTAGSDPAGLLTRSIGLPPALRLTPPTPTPQRPRHIILRYALAAIGGALLALAVTVPFLGAKPEPVLDPPGTNTVGNNSAPGVQPVAPVRPDDLEEPEAIRLTYGPSGPTRPDHRVLPDEEVYIEYVLRGVGKDRKGEVDLSVAGELLDRDGKKWTELAPAPLRGLLYPLGSTFTGNMSYGLSASQPPGDYRARARVVDRVTGRAVNFEHPVYVLAPQFGAVRLRLSHDPEGKWATGCHLTVGQSFFVQGRAVSFVRKNGRVHVGMNVSARDRDGHETTAAPLKPLDLDREANDKFTYFDFNFGPLKTVMAGEVTIVVEMRDEIADKTARYELPIMIHPPRSIRGPGKEQ
jgi:hypothetical protein